MILSIDKVNVTFGMRIELAAFPELVNAHLGRCPDTEKCETLGAGLNGKLVAGGATEGDVREFILSVCNWAGSTGNRVRGKVEKSYDGALALSSFQSAATALAASTPTSGSTVLQTQLKLAADSIDDIPGLSTSFATKMIRILRPEIAGVLDSVTSLASGYRLNNASFALYCTDCLTIARTLQSERVTNPRTVSTTWRAGDVDQALYARCQGWA